LKLRHGERFVIDIRNAIPFLETRFVF
jgi:hypothetical protein